MVTTLISFLLDQIGQLIRFLRQRVHDRHLHDMQTVIVSLAQAENTLAIASHEGADAHEHLALATTSLTETQTALIEQMTLNRQSTEHLAQAVDRLTALLAYIAERLPSPRIVDALPPSRDLSQAPRRQAD